MVSENFLNLLEDIEGLRNIELAIFTTYSFDHVFFEHFLMRSLRRNNPGVTIVVLVDDEHYPNIRDFTESTGTEYLLLPITSTLFHPKLFLFFSKKKGIAYIGSHNLTLNGITHNLELTFKTEESQLIYQAMAFLIEVINNSLGDKNPISDTIDRYKNSIKLDKEKSGIHLIHNLKKPILQTALNILANENYKFTEATIFAPFFSNEKSLIEKIAEGNNIKKIDVCIQKFNHNLNVDRISGLRYVSIKEVIQKENRRMHSKFLIFKGKKTFALMGSPNFTDPALNQIAEPGNIEFAVLVEQKESQIFDEIALKEITSQDVRNSKRKDLPILSRETQYEVNVTMAEIDSFGQLIISMKSKVSQEKNLVLIVDQCTEKQSIPVLLKKDEKRVTVQSKINGPLSLWFEDNTQRVSNIIRVYNPSEIVLSLSKNAADPHLVPSLLANTKNLEDLFRIIVALFPEENHNRTPSQTGKIGGPSPGRFLKTEGQSQDIFEILMNLLNSPRNVSRIGPNRTEPVTVVTLKPASERKSDEEEFSDDDIGEDSEEDEYQWAVSKLFEKWTEAFETRRLAKDNSPANYSAFLLISLKMIEILVDHEQEQEYYVNDIMNSLAGMFGTYGSSGKREEMLLLMAIILSIECDIKKLDKSNDYEIIKGISDGIDGIESLLFSENDILIGLKLGDQINHSLNEAKVLHSIENTARLKRIIAFMVAITILKKKRRTHGLIIKTLVDQLKDAKEDESAFYISLVLQSLFANGANSEVVITEIDAKLRNPELRRFRRILYNDILESLGK